MVFEYEELKECVEEDFERFYKMGFSAIQILPAVLNEYEHGEEFCFVENICIHVCLTLLYKEKDLKCNDIIGKLNQMVGEGRENEIMTELGNDYSKFLIDLNNARERDINYHI